MADALKHDVRRHPVAERIHRKIDALTGLRGVAILIVIVGHLMNNRFDQGTALYWITLPVQNPDIGVQIFFVLSGYLITGILVGEKSRTGTISIRRFYARRAYRILPAYYGFLAAGIVLVVIGVRSANAGNFAACFAFVSNYFQPGTHAQWLEHTWSLAVEEQFYLLWPFVLWRCSGRWALLTAATLIIASPVLRVGERVLTGTVDWFHFQNRLDSLLIGAALALIAALHPTLTATMRDAVDRFHRTYLARGGGLCGLACGWVRPGAVCARGQRGVVGVA